MRGAAIRGERVHDGAGRGLKPPRLMGKADDIVRAARVLRAGGLVVFHTETAYGLKIRQRTYPVLHAQKNQGLQ